MKDHEDKTSSAVRRDAITSAASPRPWRRISITIEDAKAIIGLLEGYESALNTMDLKLLNSGRNDERFPLAIREVRRVVSGLKAALDAVDKEDD